MRKDPLYLALRHGTVRKSNDLVQSSRYYFSAQQQKVLLYIISQIKPSDAEFSKYTFYIPDFCKVCGIDVSGKNYKDLKDAILGIRNSGFWLTRPDGKLRAVAWIKDAEIDPGDGMISIWLHEDMRPFLLQLKRNFTTYELVYTLHFRSKYSIRMYELIKSIHYHEQETYQREFTIEELRDRLGVVKYSEYRDMKKRVLLPSIEEINEFSDKTVSMEEVKRGRKVIAIILSIETKETLEVIRIRDQIDKSLGLDPNQMTLWDQLEAAGHV